MKMVATSIMFHPNQLARLRALAHRKSLETGQEFSLGSLVRETVTKHLLTDEAIVAQQTGDEVQGSST